MYDSQSWAGPFAFFVGALCVVVPLAVWKVVDLIVLLCHHVSVSFH